jgi:F0F1-type ATP synthase delta subunit
MKTPRTRIAKVVADQALKTGGSKKLSREIAAYLLETRRTGELNSLMRDIEKVWAEQGYVEVMAYSAHPLTPAVRTDITKQAKALYPQAKMIVVTEVHDESVVGGVRLTVAEQQLDLSIQSKLNQFKQLTLAGKE